jgi:hypothetical protein
MLRPQQVRLPGIASVRGSAFLAFGTHGAGVLALVACPIDTSTPDHTRNLFPGIASTFARRVLGRRRVAFISGIRFRPVIARVNALLAG